MYKFGISIAFKIDHIKFSIPVSIDPVTGVTDLPYRILVTNWSWYYRFINGSY